MYKVLKTSKNGEKREMFVNTETYHRILKSPGVFGDKFEIIKEKAPEPVATVVTPDDFPIKDEKIDTEAIYGEAEYKADVAQAKKEPTIEILERMLAYKPTPYWKGKLNKLINE